MAEIQKSPLQIEREAMDLEYQQLQLEEMRENAARRRSLKAQKQQIRKATEEGLEDSRMQQKIREESCPHRKGGKDLAGLHVGNSADHSVIMHTLAHGPVMVLCTRCMKQWDRPEKMVLDGNTGKPIKNPHYAAELKEYRAALNLPTDNVPSGTRLFDIRETAAA